MNDMVDYQYIGHRLRQRRREYGLSATEIATRSGLSRQVVYRIENMENVTIKSLVAYCEALGLRIAIQVNV